MCSAHYFRWIFKVWNHAFQLILVNVLHWRGLLTSWGTWHLLKIFFAFHWETLRLISFSGECKTFASDHKVYWGNAKVLWANVKVLQANATFLSKSNIFDNDCKSFLGKKVLWANAKFIGGMQNFCEKQKHWNIYFPVPLGAPYKI